MSSSAALPRTEPFGTRTSFAASTGRFFAAAKLALLQALRPEDDARSLGSLHFAYWVIVPRKRMARLRRGSHVAFDGAAYRDQMLFLSDFSGDWEVYLVGFNRVLLSALDFAWGDSVGWKQRMEIKDYLRFVRMHEIESQYYFSRYATAASVEDVRGAVFVSEELDRFALITEGADADRFAKEFKQLRIRLGNCLSA